MKEKHSLLVMFLCLSLMFCIPNVQYAKNIKSKPTPGTAIFVMALDSSPIQITERKLQYKGNGLDLKMSIPQFKNLEHQAFQKKLNSNLMKSAHTRKKEQILMAKSLQKDLIKDHLKAIPFEYVETYSVINSPFPYYTLELHKSQYSGGAHSINELSYLTIDQTHHQVITLQDLFRENIDYISLLNDFVRQEIKERIQKGESFFTGSNGFQSIGSNTPFFIDGNGDLILVFNVFEIAPYSHGTVHIKVPQSTVKPYMK